MIKTFYLLLYFLLCSPCHAIDKAELGYVTNICIYQTLNGMIDGYRDALNWGINPKTIRENRAWNKEPGNYHLFKLANVTSGLLAV